MASRLKRFFSGKEKLSSTSSNPNVKGRSYDSAIALDPPVKGSYPVAGNGPNVLDELQRSRSKRETQRQSVASTGAAAQAIPRVPDDIIERPRTAPHNGRPGGGFNDGSRGDRHGRTRSGFSMKSPPTVLSLSRWSSIYSNLESHPPPVLTSISKPPTPKPREVKAYQPRKASDPSDPDVSSIFTPPYAQHQRNASQMSHRSYVDLLDAHSSIRPSRDVSRDRAKASGMRNYGEDVADRNIAAFDLNSPEFSYLKSVYVSQKDGVALPQEGVSSRASSTSHGLAQAQIASDDIQPSRNQTKANSTQSSNSAQSRPVAAYPPRIDSTSTVTYASNRRQHDDWLPPSIGVHDHRTRTLSSFSTSASIDEEPEEPGHQPFVPTGSTPPPLPARGRARTLTKDNRKSPPVSFSRGSVPVLSQQKPTGNTPSLRDRRRTMSEVSQSSSTSGGTHSRSVSATYSAFHSPSRHDFSAGTQSATRGQYHGTANKGTGMIVEGAKEPPSLDEVVDLSNTVDTDGTTKTMPAVTHEKVVPTRHEICEERITREIHTHDVFHRILPVIETEILPPKHYVPSTDRKGLIEIPEYMVSGRTANGSPSRNWEIVQTGMGKGDHGSTLHREIPLQQSRIRSKSLTSSNGQYTHPDIHEDDSAEGPVISYTRGESKANHSRANSRTSSHTSKSSISKNVLEPILSSKKEYIAKEGHLKTEYAWRHPRVFETATGETQPIYMGAGLGDLGLPRAKMAPSKAAYSDDEEEDTAGAEFGAMRRSPVGEEEFLFRDSGYGSGGMLPGLRDKTSLAGLSDEPRFIPEDFEVIRLGRVVGNEAGENGKGRDISEGEATRDLRSIREKRSSGAASVASTIRANERENSVDAVERG